MTDAQRESLQAALDKATKIKSVKISYEDGTEDKIERGMILDYHIREDGLAFANIRVKDMDANDVASLVNIVLGFGGEMGIIATVSPEDLGASRASAYEKARQQEEQRLEAKAAVEKDPEKILPFSKKTPLS